MIYNTKLTFEVQKLKKYVLKLIEKGAKVEVTEKTARSLSQNAFVHLLFGFYGVETGHQLDEVKEIIKHEIGHKFESSGLPRPTSSYSKEEMKQFIDRFYHFAGLQGIVLPTSEQAPECADYIERNRLI